MLSSVWRVLLLTVCCGVVSLKGQMQEIQCHCNTAECTNNTCLASVRCEMELDIYDNHTLKAIHWSCLDDAFFPCLENVPHKDQNYTTYTYCCDDVDYCNKCTLPEGTPWQVIPSLPLPAGCPMPVLPPLTTTTVMVTPSPATSVGQSSGLVESTNTVEEPGLPSNPSTNTLAPRYQNTIIALSATVFVGVILLVIVIFICSWRRRQAQNKVDSIGNLTSTFDPELDLQDGTMSGSSGAGGAGQRILEERTIAKQIKKKHLLDRGRYGEVWLGEWNGSDVAIKIFQFKEQDSWRREGEIYQTHMLNHENIVRFITQAKFSDLYEWRLWMVIEFHHNGSLSDYLLTKTLTTRELHKIILSIANGLQYLHLDVTTGDIQKPGIAHRDLKSRNILVKSDGSCCIADFGLALRHNLKDGSVDQMPSNTRQGTKRYMAPELLDGSINAALFESYRMVDVYSFGLIMWEVARRCEVHGEAEAYELPYYDQVSHDPSFDEMKKVVAIEEIRPNIEERWRDKEFLSVLSSVMQECWRTKPHARLTAFRIRKTLAHHSNEYKNGYKH